MKRTNVKVEAEGARRLNDRPSEPAYKRPFDLALLVSAYVALSPIWLLLWILIPLSIWLNDRGPVFYRQRRAGRDGFAITVSKFRTMVPGAENLGPAWTREGDPRITRVGRVLRRTALDELPETLNILKGEMSFVGPRALDVGEHELLDSQISGFRDRLMVRPGLTGMAQVYNPQDDNVDKLRYDLDYIANMSVWLDIKLILLSVRNTLFGRWDARQGKKG